jgi:hypothetical protein
VTCVAPLSVLDFEKGRKRSATSRIYRIRPNCNINLSCSENNSVFRTHHNVRYECTSCFDSHHRWEFGGQYLSTDHPTGRIIRFPNSEVLSSAIYNYTWPLFPYVWNEIKFNIAYESDLDFVAMTMREVAEEEVGKTMMERIRVYRELLAQTPVDALEVREHPAVLFRVDDNIWLEAIVRYLVHPKEAGRVKTRLIKKLLARLNAEPERVLFPKSNAR